MVKKTSLNVYDKALERIEFCFKEFDNVIVSFSGGKDSGVMLNLCYDYAKEHNLLHKLSVVHIDYEAQYQMTTDYVEETFKKLSDIKRFWLCLPIHAQCACRMDGATWIPWEKSKKDIWCRDMPKHDYVINEDNMEFEILETDFEIPKDFFKWFTEKYGKTASVIGIRTQESYERLCIIIKTDRNLRYKGKNWTITKHINNEEHGKLVHCYPIHDWKTEDIWVYNAKFEKHYNRLYDLFYQAGLSIDQMRVASPFNDSGIHTLKLYKVIDPKNWGKMVGRVNGVSFAGLYGGTTAMGWRKITKPNHLTWKEYCYFLLGTLDEKTRNHYLLKLEVSKKSWVRGGVMDEETVAELKKENSPAIYTGQFKWGKEIIQFNDYVDDTTVSNFRRIPSYKRMCVCIIKNDYYCKYMGFGLTREEYERRARTLEIYKNL